MTKEEILKETIEYYSVPGRRSLVINEDGETEGCFYKGPNGENCAVGRVLTPEALEFAHKNMNKSNLNDLKNAMREELDISFDEALKEEYRGHNETTFWTRLQYLHDGCENWNKKGLTERGEALVLSMCRDFGLDHFVIFPCKSS